jgi:hypothetical protein
MITAFQKHHHIFALLLIVLLCGCTDRSPIGVARRFVALRDGLRKRPYAQSYSLLTRESKNSMSRDRYCRFADIVAAARAELQRRGKKPPRRLPIRVLSARLLLSDAAHPEYRRVRIETSNQFDTSEAPLVKYYTLQKEKGRWLIVWPEAHTDSASRLFNAADYLGAQVESNRALNVDPYSATAYDRIAWCFARTSMPLLDAYASYTDSVEKYARRALELEPDVPERYNTLALAQVLPELQIECYRKGLGSRYCSKGTRAVLY